ncbi:hypothetical protein [Secundilactobacillus yichangensis]|uniref:hypothetical protein n=1 Tax=Secundilactobacillus yichangensis TaxID=2799580 RepID=UPI001943773F|nr:hypothetical protein [Secundilactobacillus yichangensis]
MKDDIMNNDIGFIKFIDEQYIDDYFALSELWLANVDNFTSNEELKAEDLINDRDEGRAGNFSSNMPAFITCFTKIQKTDFDSSGKLNHDMVDSLLKSEVSQGNKRPFIVISKKHMDNLMSQIIAFNAEPHSFPIEHSNIFVREIRYVDEYNKISTSADQSFRENWNVNALAEVMYSTKDIKYQAQHELRIGIVYEVEKTEGYLPGRMIKLPAKVELASCKLNSNDLATLDASCFFD